MSEVLIELNVAYKSDREYSAGEHLTMTEEEASRLLAMGAGMLISLPHSALSLPDKAENPVPTEPEPEKQKTPRGAKKAGAD